MHTTQTAQLPGIPPLDNTTLLAQLQNNINNKTKPVGSLGRLESVAVQIGLILGTTQPELMTPQMVVVAGDHGLAERGVSAFPSDVTWQMVMNFLQGGACVSVLAKANRFALNVIDAGVKHDFDTDLYAILQDAKNTETETEKTPRFFNFKIAHGTQDSSIGNAMSQAQCEQAIGNGRHIVKHLPGNCILLGEMGIGNTAAASLILSQLCGLPIADCTGAGTGLVADGLQRKIDVLQSTLAFHAQKQHQPLAPLSVLAAFGGFEMATLLGVVWQAALEKRVVVVDGFITTAVVLLAQAMDANVLSYCVFAHRSDEKAHSLMLQHIAKREYSRQQTENKNHHTQPIAPILDLGLRLGEGSGAALVLPVLEAACAILSDMASFSAAGVSEKMQ